MTKLLAYELVDTTDERILAVDNMLQPWLGLTSKLHWLTDVNYAIFHLLGS